jgi:hypothetical protein
MPMKPAFMLFSLDGPLVNAADIRRENAAAA